MALTRATDKIIANADGNINLSGIVTASSFVGNVTGVVTPSGDVNVGNNIKLGAASGIITATSFRGDGSQLTGVTSVGGATGVDFNDNVKIRLGTGNDIEFYHNGSHNFIDITNGQLRIRHGTDNAIKTIADGATILYYDGGQRIQTTTGGIEISGETITNSHIELADNARLKLGTGEDFQAWHDGTNTNITNNTNDLNITNTGDDIVITANDDINLKTNAGDNAVNILGGAAVELYHAGSKKFETTSGGVTVTGGLTATAAVAATSMCTLSGGFKTGADESKAQFGASDDFEIWHSSNSNSYIKNSTGELKIASDNIALMTTDQSEKFIDCNGNGNVELYYDNSKKFQTVSNGIQVAGIVEGMSGDHLTFNTASSHNLQFRTNGVLRFSLNTSGHLEPYVNNTYDLGTNAKRFRNIYTNDLNLSNEGSTNDVDGTWGNYTIQEGESDLYLINNRNGKKYKFNLTEVS